MPPLCHDDFASFWRRFCKKTCLPFAEVLPEEQIEKAFADAGAEFAQEQDDVYTPPVTLWAFLSQVLFKEEQRSCLAAVSRVLVLLVSLGRAPCAKNSGAYCRARAKLRLVEIQVQEPASSRP